MWLLALIVGLPLIEISLFVVIGGWIGLWPTLAIVIGTAALGVWLLKQEGERARSGLRASLNAGRSPTAMLAGGAFRAVAAMLLILPGFLTDTIGLLLLLPPVQHWVSSRLSARAKGGFDIHMQSGGWDTQAVRRRPDEVIDTTWEELPPDDAKESSGWTRH